MTPYEKVEQLIDIYGVRDVLLMVVEVMQDKQGYVDYSVAIKWDKGAKAIAQAIRKLPKYPGIK